MDLSVSRIFQAVAPIGSRDRSGRGGHGFEQTLKGDQEEQGPPPDGGSSDRMDERQLPSRPRRRPRIDDGKGLKVDLLA
ncbi:MAG: hypothetical protein ACE5F1_12745 [Planctomycetota bacterium]